MAESPKESLHRILRDLGFQRVVCVDDFYDRRPDIETILAWAQVEANRNSLRGRLKAKGVELDVAAETFSIELRTALEGSVDLANFLEKGIDADQEKARKSGTAMPAPSREAVDRAVLGKFAELMDGWPDIRICGVSEWSAQKDGLLREASTVRTLFVFDEELGDQVPKGTDQIESLHNTIPDAGCAFILLSYVVAQGQEHDRTRRLQQKGIAATAIPKLDLNDAANAEFIYIRVRAAILWKEANELRSACIQAMRDSIDAVRDRVENLTPLEFDEVVFRSSHKEGVHEIDTLIRVYSNVFASEFRERLRGNALALEDIAALRGYRATEKRAKVGSAAWRLQREELYEPASYINGCNTPLEAGDIFRFESEADTNLGTFALVAQPCDLLVRNEKEPGERNARIVLLAPIVERSPAKDEKGVFELRFYREGQSAVLDMSALRTVDIRFLDLTVLNSDGRAAINPEDLPKRLTNGWSERVSTILLPFARSKIKAWEQWMTNPTTPDHLVSCLPEFVATLGERDVIKCEVISTADGKKTLRYGIKRIERLSNGLAAELLQAYGDHLSRPARPHILSEQPEAY